METFSCAFINGWHPDNALVHLSGLTAPAAGLYGSHRLDRFLRRAP